MGGLTLFDDGLSSLYIINYNKKPAPIQRKKSFPIIYPRG